MVCRRLPPPPACSKWRPPQPPRATETTSSSCRRGPAGHSLGAAGPRDPAPPRPAHGTADFRHLWGPPVPDLAPGPPPLRRVSFAEPAAPLGAGVSRPKTKGATESQETPEEVRGNPAPERGWGGRAQGRARPSPLGARPESPVTRPRTPGPVGRPRAPGARSVSPASALLLGGPSPRQGHWGRARGAPGPRGRRGGPEPLRHAEISRLAAPATPESPRRLTPAGAPAPAPSVPSGSRQKKPPARPNRTARQE